MPQLPFMRFKNGTAGSTYEPVAYNSSFFAPPGDSSSQSRFIRLAMLNSAAALRGWPLDVGFSPNGTHASQYPSKVSCAQLAWEAVVHQCDDVTGGD